MNIVFIGPPGSGKGTQAKMIADKYDLRHLSSGDLLRSHIENDTEIGKDAQQYMRNGELVPNSIIIEMILGEIEHTKGFILDGFPRELGQAVALDHALAERNRKIDLAIFFVVQEDLVVERLGERLQCTECKTQYNSSTLSPKHAGVCDSCGSKLLRRDDDHPKVIRHRLKVYKQQTEPLDAYYRNKGLLTSIDASNSIDSVHSAITELMKEHTLAS